MKVPRFWDCCRSIPEQILFLQKEIAELETGEVTKEQFDQLQSHVVALQKEVDAIPNYSADIEQLRSEITDVMGDVSALAADKQDKLTFDATPTEGSYNPVTSDGIRKAIDAAQPKDVYTKQETDALINQVNDSVASAVTDLTGEINAKQDTLTFDTTPTKRSNNPVTSGGLFNWVERSSELSGGPTNYVPESVSSLSNIFGNHNTTTKAFAFSVIPAYKPANNQSGAEFVMFGDAFAQVNEPEQPPYSFQPSILSSYLSKKTIQLYSIDMNVANAASFVTGPSENPETKELIIVPYWLLGTTFRPFKNSLVLATDNGGVTPTTVAVEGSDGSYEILDGFRTYITRDSQVQDLTTFSVHFIQKA